MISSYHKTLLDNFILMYDDMRKAIKATERYVSPTMRHKGNNIIQKAMMLEMLMEDTNISNDKVDPLLKSITEEMYAYRNDLEETYSTSNYRKKKSSKAKSKREIKKCRCK